MDNSNTNTLLNHTKVIINSGLEQLKHLKDKEILFFSIIIIGLLIFSSIYYIHSKLNLNKINCLNLRKIYTTSPKLNSITNNPNFNKHCLRDFYIKTAYNCCCGGEFKNDYVNLCALSTCISQGARCLDFEIYSIDDKPVVAASSVDDYSIKETYNSIPIKDVFNTIVKEAFSSGNCPNFNDPLIIHFRIMSNNCKMYDNLANIISNMYEFNSKTLGKKYSYEFKDDNSGSKNLGALPISNFEKKIIIAVDGTNPLYQHTKLDEYINIASGSAFLHLMRFRDVKYTQDLTLTDFNKKNMTIVLPNVGIDDSNPNFNISRQYGCQFIGMSFQNYDINLEHYNEFFDSNKAAFVLKPKNLRFIPLTIPKPPPQNPKYSYKTRPIKSDFYSYKI